MYKIILEFTSNIKDVYTREEEIVTDEFYLKIKKNIMVDKWLKNLCPYINFDILNEEFIKTKPTGFDDIPTYKKSRIIKKHEEEFYCYKIKLINQHLKQLNILNYDNIDNRKEQPREFKIIIDKIE
jgi:hypothetical protein